MCIKLFFCTTSLIVREMKIKFNFVIICLLFFVIDVKAQCDSVPRVEMPIELSCFNSFKNKNVTIHGYTLDLGVNILKRVAVIGSVEFNTFHLEVANNYSNTFQIGGGFLYQPIKNRYNVLGVKGKVGKTTSSSEMKNTNYDVSIGYSKCFKVVGVSSAVGFRICDYKNSYIPDNHFIYISAGLRF